MAKYKEYVNAITERLMDTENYKSAKDYAMARYLMEQKSRLRPTVNGTSLAECLLDANTHSMTNKFKRVTRFAKDKSVYPYGVPKSSITTEAVSGVKGALEDYLTTKEGKPLTFLYVKLNSRNAYHFAWEQLYAELGYNGETNELKVMSIKAGNTAYLKGGQLYLTQATADRLLLDGNTDQNGLSMSYGSTPDRVINTNREQPEPLIGDSNKLVVTYVYKDGLISKEDTVELNLDFIEPNAIKPKPITQPSLPSWMPKPPTVDPETIESEDEYLQTMYFDGTSYRVFNYRYMSGGIPAIDKAESYQEEFGQFYPRIYLRQDAKDLMNLPKDNKARVGTEKLMRKIGLDLKEVTESINEGIEDLNDTFKYTFIHLTISINKEMDDQTTGNYLFNYFDALYARSTAIPIKDQQEPILPNERKGITQDVSDNTYSQVVSYWKSGKTNRAGKAKNNKGVDLKKGEYCVKFTTISLGTGDKWYKKAINGGHELIYQVTDTTHIVITVMNLVMVHQFYGKSIKCEWSDDGLTIPLDSSVVNKLKGSDSDLLLNKGLQITIATYQRIKKKWYERGVFKVAMVVVSVVINMFVPGAGFALSAFLSALATTIIMSIAITVLMTVALELAIRLGISPEILAVLTALATAAVLAYGGGKFDFSKVMNAKSALTALNYSVDMYQKGIGKAIEAIQKEMDLFAEYAKDQSAKLKEAQKMLDTGMIPPDLELLTAPINEMDIYLGETPEQFYTRAQGIDIVDLSYNMEAYFIAIFTSPPEYVSKRELTVDIEDILLIT